VIQAVVDQIVDGWTELGSHGFRSNCMEPANALDKIRRRLAEASSEIAKDEIETLKQLVVQAEKSRDEAWNRLSCPSRLRSKSD